MVAIRGHVMVDRRADSIFPAVGINKRFSVTPAAMEFGEPNVRYPFVRTELGCVVNPGALVQLIGVNCSLCHNGQTPPNTVDVFVSAAFVKRLHFGCRIRQGHST